MEKKKHAMGEFNVNLTWVVGERFPFSTGLSWIGRGPEADDSTIPGATGGYSKPLTALPCNQTGPSELPSQRSICSPCLMRPEGP